MATLDTKEQTKELTIQDLKHALFNGKSNTVTDVAFLKHLKDNPNAQQQLLESEELLKKADGRKRLLRKRVESLLAGAKEEVTIARAKEYFKSKEKRSWGKWAYDSLKSVVLFPVRHPLITLLLSLAALGGAYYYAGNLEALMAQVGLDKVKGATEAARKLAVPTIATPVEAGGGVLEVVPPALNPTSPYTPGNLEID